MVLQVVVQLMKTFLVFVANIWRRALCCFRRRRRVSSDSIQLTAVGVVSDVVSDRSRLVENETWDSWDEPASVITQARPSSVQEQIELYRQQQAKAVAERENDEPQQDFFEDMTPRITRQTKLYIDDGEQNRVQNTSNLSLAPQPIIAPVGELGEWMDSGGWEEETLSEWDPQSALREKRRQERERRIWEQQQRRQERAARPASLGARIS